MLASLDRQHDPAQQAHEHHREADGIEDIHAQQIAERRPAPGDDVFLQTEEQAEGKNFRTTADGGAGDLRGEQVSGFAAFRLPGRTKFPLEIKIREQETFLRVAST